MFDTIDHTTLNCICRLEVPQGSVLAPLLFSLLATPLSKVIEMHHGIKLHFYTDDTKLFIHISHKNAALAFVKLNSCLLDVQEWMSSSMVKLNQQNRVYHLWISCSTQEIRSLPPFFFFFFFFFFINDYNIFYITELRWYCILFQAFWKHHQNYTPYRL